MTDSCDVRMVGWLKGTIEKIERMDDLSSKNLIISSLNKRIPKPVKKEEDLLTGCFSCPSCGELLRLPLIDKYDYCPYCGQHLLWPGGTDELCQFCEYHCDKEEPNDK